MEKATLRQDIRRRIDRLSAQDRGAQSAAVCRQVLTLAAYRQARCVMMYRALPDEVNLAELERQARLAGKHIVLPRCRGHEMDLVQVVDDPRAFAPGPFGIAEPTGAQLAEPGEIDLVMTPGRAFDRRGNRLGRAGGFYDRLFASQDVQAVRCAVAFDCQIIEDVPHHDHDQPVDLIVTANEVIRCGERDCAT